MSLLLIFIEKNWLAEATEALQKRIRRCVERIPAETVLATAKAVRKFTIYGNVFKIVQRTCLFHF